MLKSDVTEKAKAGYFDHEKWDVYQAALEFVILISDIVEQLPRGKAFLVDQLQRAGTSVPLNIAEGAGEDAINEKARFYRMARRSATECASILDVCHRLRLIDGDRYAEGRTLLLRIVAMLTKMGRAETGYKSTS
jgi:four helix bundle protein